MKIYHFVLIALLLIACEPEAFPESPEVEQEAIEQEVVREEVEEKEPLVKSVYGSKGALEEYCELKPDFSARYNVKSVLDGETFEDVQTVARKGMNYKQEVESDSFIVKDDKGYACRKGDQWYCFELPEEGSAEEDCTVPDEIDVKKIDDMQLVGQTSKCFELTSDSYTGRDVHCFSEEGAPVYFYSEAEGNIIERKATYLAFSVSDSEFDLPAEAQEYDPEFFQSIK